MASNGVVAGAGSRTTSISRNSLYYSLSHHSAGNLHEACDVCSLHVVDIAVTLLAVADTLFVYAVHNRVQARVNKILTLARKTARGLYGNGPARKRRLGADYDLVQWVINHNLYK